MKEKIEKRIEALAISEFSLIQEIGNLEKNLTDKRAQLISTRGGIIELNLINKEEEE